MLHATSATLTIMFGVLCTSSPAGQSLVYSSTRDLTAVIDRRGSGSEDRLG